MVNRRQIFILTNICSINSKSKVWLHHSALNLILHRFSLSNAELVSRSCFIILNFLLTISYVYKCTLIACSPAFSSPSTCPLPYSSPSHIHVFGFVCVPLGWTMVVRVVSALELPTGARFISVYTTEDSRPLSPRFL